MSLANFRGAVNKVRRGAHKLDMFKIATGHNLKSEREELMDILKLNPEKRVLNSAQIFVLKKYFQEFKFFAKIIKLFEDNQRQLGFLVERFIKAVQIKEYKAGQIIQKEGDKEINFHLFIEGKANAVVQKTGEQVKEEEDLFTNLVIKYDPYEVLASPLRKKRSNIFQQRNSKIILLRKQTKIIQNFDGMGMSSSGLKRNNSNSTSPLKKSNSINVNTGMLSSRLLTMPRQQQSLARIDEIGNIGNTLKTVTNNNNDIISIETFSDSSDYFSESSFSKEEDNPLYECFFKNLQNPTQLTQKIIQKQTTGFKHCFGEIQNDDMENLKYFIKNNVLQVQFGHHIKQGDSSGSADILKARGRASESLVAVTDVKVAVLNSKDFSDILNEPEELKFETKVEFLSMNIGLQFKNPLSFLINKLEKVKKYKGQYIYKQNDSVNGCYIIKRGDVEISRQVNLITPDKYMNHNSLHQTALQKSMNIQLSLLGSGQYIGEDEIVKKEKKRLFTAICTSETKLYYIELIHFKKLIHDNNLLYMELLNKISQKMEWYNEKLEKQQKIFQEQYEKGYEQQDVTTSRQIIEHTKKKQFKSELQMQKQVEYSQQLQKIQEDKKKQFHNKIKVKDIEKLKFKQKAKLVQQLKKPFRDHAQALDFDDKIKDIKKKYVKRVKLKELQFRNFSFWPQNYRHGLIFEDQESEQFQQQHKQNLQKRMDVLQDKENKDDIHVMQQNVYQNIYNQETIKFASGQQQNIQNSPKKKRRNEEFIEFKEQYVYTQQGVNLGFKQNKQENQSNKSISLSEQIEESVNSSSVNGSFHFSDFEDNNNSKKQQTIQRKLQKAKTQVFLSRNQSQTSLNNNNTKINSSQISLNNNNNTSRVQSSQKFHSQNTSPIRNPRKLQTSTSFIAPKVKLRDIQKTDAIQKHYVQKYRQKLLNNKKKDSKYKIVQINNVSKKTISNQKGVPFLEHELMRDPQSRGKIINSIRKATAREKLQQTKKEGQKIAEGVVAFHPLFDKIKSTVIDQTLQENNHSYISSDNNQNQQQQPQQEQKRSQNSPRKILQRQLTQQHLTRKPSTSLKKQQSSIQRQNSSIKKKHPQSARVIRNANSIYEEEDNSSIQDSQNDSQENRISRQQSKYQREQAILSQVDLFGKINDLYSNPKQFLTKMSSIDLKGDEYQSFKNKENSQQGDQTKTSQFNTSRFNTPRNNNVSQSGNTSPVKRCQSSKFSDFYQRSQQVLQKRDTPKNNVNNDINNNEPQQKQQLQFQNSMQSINNLFSSQKLQSQQTLSQNQITTDRYATTNPEEIQSNQQLNNNEPIQSFTYVQSQNLLQSSSKRKLIKNQQNNNQTVQKRESLKYDRVMSARNKSGGIGNKIKQQMLQKQLSQASTPQQISRLNTATQTRRNSKTNDNSVMREYYIGQQQKQQLQNSNQNSSNSQQLQQQQLISNILIENNYKDSCISYNELSGFKSNEMVDYYSQQQQKSQQITQDISQKLQQYQKQQQLEQNQLYSGRTYYKNNNSNLNRNQQQKEQKQQTNLSLQNSRNTSQNIKIYKDSTVNTKNNMHVKKKKSQYVTIVNHMGKPIKYHF